MCQCNLSYWSSDIAAACIYWLQRLFVCFFIMRGCETSECFSFFWQTIFRHVASSPILINIIPYFKKLRKYACKRKTCRLHLAWQIFYAHRRIIMYPSYVHTYRQWEEQFWVQRIISMAYNDVNGGLLTRLCSFTCIQRELRMMVWGVQTMRKEKSGHSDSC